MKQTLKGFSTLFQSVPHTTHILPAHKIPSFIPAPLASSLAPSKFDDKITIYSAEEIVKIREACRITAKAISAGRDASRIGGTSEEIDKAVHYAIVGENAYPAAIGYMGFPKSVCTSVNDGFNLKSALSWCTKPEETRKWRFYKHRHGSV